MYATFTFLRWSSSVAICFNSITLIIRLKYKDIKQNQVLYWTWKKVIVNTILINKEIWNTIQQPKQVNP